MTALPSFVELMSSLGLESQDSNPNPSSPPCSPRLSVTAPSPTHTRSRSHPVLRESASSTRLRNARFSPYSPTTIGARRGSTSSTSSVSDLEQPSRAISSSPIHSRRLRRIASAHLTVNIFDSASDSSANMPISSYVRRKTPGASPTSSLFSVESNPTNDSPSDSPMPFSIPTIPNFFPRSPNSDTNFPITPDANMDIVFPMDQEPLHQGKDLPILPEIRRNRHTGIRISTHPWPAR